MHINQMTANSSNVSASCENTFIFYNILFLYFPTYYLVDDLKNTHKKYIFAMVCLLCLHVFFLFSLAAAIAAVFIIRYFYESGLDFQCDSALRFEYKLNIH